MLHFLLLEDDPIDRELIEATLINGGIESIITQISDRQTFVEILRTQPLDLILADYVLPKFDGLEALALAQSICPDVPFILVSGVLGEEQAVEALQQGAGDYVLKQRLQRLVPAVNRALRESQERQERQKITKALHKTDNLLQTIINASPTSIITFNLAGKVMTWNPAAEQLYGWSKKAVYAQPLPVIPEPQQASFDGLVKQALNNEKVLNQEQVHLTQASLSVNVSLSLSPLYNDSQIYGVVMTVIDITERKRVEAERRRSEAALAQQARALTSANNLLLEAKLNLEHRNRDLKQFAYAISHDLKAPLRGIDNLSAWIVEDCADQLSPDSKHHISLLRQRVGRMEALIDDLLKFARVGQTNTLPGRVDLNELLAEIIDLLAPPESFTVHIQPHLPVLLARRLSLHQVFANLISNAIKYNHLPDGCITITARVQEKGYEFSVADNGPGIDPEHHERIFDIFQTLEACKTAESTGIGLSIVKRIVEMEGGEISVESELGSGAIFRFTWPASEQSNLRLPPEKS